MTTIDNKPPKVHFETKLVLITPAMAKATLEHNAKNRTLTPARVDEFVALMKSGKFQCTHQGIALDSDGNVLDGQHRLAAIVKSWCSVWMLVSKGVPDSARLAVDTGKPRTAIAISKLVGRTTDSTAKFAIARILKYGPIRATQMHIPPEILFDLVDTFSEGIDFAYPCGFGIPSTILAVVARASYTKDKARLREFMEVYRNDRPYNEGDTSVIKLKLFVSSKKGSAASNTCGGTVYKNYKQYLYNISESAIADFLNGYPTKMLKETKSEKFPLPQELDGWNGH